MNNEQHTRTVAARFSAAAETYDRHSAVQNLAAAELMADLPVAPEPERIMEIGCGTGILTAMLIRRFSRSALDAVDISGRMIQTARKSIGPAPNICWREMDIMEHPVDRPYPLIVSNCALHWLPDLRAGFQKIHALLESGGQLLAAIMIKGTLEELIQCRLRVAPGKPPLAELPSAEDVTKAAEQAGFRHGLYKHSRYRLQCSSVDEFLRVLHEQGLTGGRFSRSAVPLSRAELTRLKQEYQKQFGQADGAIYASYVVVYLRARKEII